MPVTGWLLISLDSDHVVGVNSSAIDKSVAEGLSFAVSTAEIRAAFLQHSKDW